jgi:hypothetical protein
MAASSASRRDFKLGPNDSKYVRYKSNQSSKSSNKKILSLFLSFSCMHFLETLPERCNFAILGILYFTRYVKIRLQNSEEEIVGNSPLQFVRACRREKEYMLPRANIL